MRKNNLFDNFLFFLTGVIIGIFLYINFFIENNKLVETMKAIKEPVEKIKYVNRPIRGYKVCFDRPS